MMTIDHSRCIAVCNSLLRGEISAVETYDKAIEKFSDQPQLSELTRIRDEHRQSVESLRANVLSMAGVPEVESGAWGVFANGVQAATNLLGEKSALFSLKQGEEYGLGQYTEALNDDSVIPECRELISTSLVPRVATHIETLERLSENL